jgi:hypothetical protein
MVAVSLGSQALPAADAPARTELIPTTNDEVLFNPGMGLYLQYPPLDAKADERLMGLCDIAYYRLDWSEVNPEPEAYRFDDYFGPRFDTWVTKHGKRVAFRVMCQNMHSAQDYVTPKWVFDRGVPGEPDHQRLRRPAGAALPPGWAHAGRRQLPLRGLALPALCAARRGLQPRIP